MPAAQSGEVVYSDHIQSKVMSDMIKVDPKRSSQEETTVPDSSTL
jgi:hypothetical protein